VIGTAMFEELYFWMHSYLQRIKGNSNPPLNASILICGLQASNIVMISGVINYFLKIKMEKYNTIYFGIALMIVLYLLNHFHLYSKRNEIFQQYENRSPERQRKGKLFFWLYVLLSLFLFFYLAANLVTPRY
jgi:hypothetical protein